MTKPWRAKVGPRGARVTVTERSLGGPVTALVWNPAKQRRDKRSLGFRVRDAKGKLVSDAVSRAKREAADLSNALIRGERPKPEAVTLSGLARQFRRDVLPMQSRRTKEESERELALLANYFGDEYDIATLGPAAYQRLWRDRGSGRIDGRGQVAKRSRPVRARAVAKTLKFLRQLCRLGVDHRLLASDPTRGFEIPRERDPRRPMMTEARYRALIDTAHSDRERALYVLARETGRRVTSILSLRWEDWWPDDGLRGTLRWRGAHDKLGRTSVVPVTEVVRETLEGLSRHSSWVFPHPRDDTRALTREIVTNWLRVSEVRADLKHDCGGFHAFRRLWATERKPFPLRDVAYAGGWSDTSTLLNIYQQPDVDTLQAVVEGRREALRVAK